ncbi:hypothetical protein AGDE_13357 [Angomonas deanei]|uniref:Sperm-tail PG-rich repeat n=1 Tax=Angomonas deanei TaxID=59799 RepID=A0A7G2C4I3_9TRYP|nr:hypothetical protein AGDE_13357 [Angomonas deanei]CAD2214640.1 hypothetical protein, conserved [Angomonas deanei]|eukprot:EPY22402.1 hypothetical protein AGDE_13357 [Angomonas deanei]
MLGRWKSTDPKSSNVGPGSYNSHEVRSAPVGGRFAAKPFDPYAATREEQERREEDQKQREAMAVPYTPYDVNYSQVERHTRGAVMGASHDLHVSANDNGVPGPGHYNPDYRIKEKGGQGTVFYKGDFILRNKQDETLGGGPGDHYNDYTPYSQSIAGDNANQKGYTFGIRYPARGTHQVALGRDASTNINCVYPDELTYETHVKLPPVKK